MIFKFRVIQLSIYRPTTVVRCETAIDAYEDSNAHILCHFGVVRNEGIP